VSATSLAIVDTWLRRGLARNRSAPAAFNQAMRTINDIRADLDRAIDRRAELWDELGGGGDPVKSAEAAELTKLIDDLWAEARALKAYERFGASDIIRARARTEERLERESRRLDRRAA
jgi:hypothetical protein